MRLPDTVDVLRRRQITAVKMLHSPILLVMAAAVLYILYRGLLGRNGAVLWIVI